MSRVKIRSNPYAKENEILIEDDGDWKSVVPNSNLNIKKFTTGFFPFIIQDMLDILMKEKRDIDCILFEGTEDDYAILYNIISNDYKNISLIKENTYLNNAEDVIKDLKQIFNESYDVIIESVGDNKGKIEKEMGKFIDASNDVIPLCVIGNYSSGKSTFINSLVGMDILPSGSKPLTQNICRILKSRHRINSYIRFDYNGQSQEITYSNNDYEITSFDTNNTILNEIVDSLDKLENHSLSINMNKTIDIINKHNDEISKIEIEVPFNSGILETINKRILIFDTPGSDTATFAKHKEVLKNELKELTNGMLIFVVEKLDNDANEELFQMINEIEEIDKRFTMIVFNKADNEELPDGGEYSEEEIEEIKELSVPRNLYSNGIYYVSSIMGLGSKICYQFVSKFNKETFIKKKDEFSNPELDYYKQLYKYDIMPAHLKKEIIEKTEIENNKLYTNSGLFAVEYEIGKFATDYASYNKCIQSKLFFENIIKTTSCEIENSKKESESEKNDIKKLLDDETHNLMHDVRLKKEEQFNEFKELYEKYMLDQKSLIQSNSNYNIDKMKNLESEIRKKCEEQFEIENEKTNAKNRTRKIDEIISNDFKQFEEGKLDEKLKKLPDIILHGANKISTLTSNAAKSGELYLKVNSATSDKLFDKVKEEFNSNKTLYMTEIINISREYFEKNIQNIKENLLKFINGNPNLNEKQKNSLSGVIVNYRDIEIERDVDKIFIKSRLKKWPKIISGLLTELDVNKVSNQYNRAISDCIDEIFEKVQENNFVTLEEWIKCLIEEIESQIVKLSPKLSTRADKIIEIESRISKLIRNRYELNSDYERINDLISWKS